MNAPRPVETAFADRRAAADMVAANGPGVVALGGGTGLPNLLRGLRPLLFGGGRAAVIDRGRLVAVVATTDDGGSSGELRKASGVIPPGDIALAADYGARGAAPLVTSPADLDHFTRSGVRAVGLPLAAEHPAGKVRHQPDRLGRAILAIAGGRLGVGRPRLVAGGR